MTALVSLSIVVATVGLAASELRPRARSLAGGVGSGRLGSLVGGVGLGRLTAMLIAAIVAGLVAGPLGIVPVVLVWYVRSVLRRRNRLRDRDHQISAGLAEVVDLFAVALASGHNLYAATQRVAQWSGEPFGGEFSDCVAAVAQGHPLADSLELLPNRLGSAVQPLTAALVAHERFGAPITQNLVALAGESRRARRHQAEVLARRLPVILLGPLVTCVLPAFLLLTVVPLVVDTVGSFTDSFSP